MKRRGSANWLVRRALVVASLLVAGCTDDHTARGLERDAATEGSALDASNQVEQRLDASPSLPPLPDGAHEPCNGRPWWCDRRYDDMVFAATHAAMAVSTPEWAHPTQHQSLRGQLDGGIRALFLELHAYQGGTAFCLDDCALGHIVTSTALAQIKAFFDVNPREVVTLAVRSYVRPELLAAEVSRAGLDALVYSPDAGSPSTFPTIGQMIRSGRRLVVLVDDRTPAREAIRDAGTARDASAVDSDSGGEGAVTATQADGSVAVSWLLPYSTFVAETASSFRSTVDMSCSPVLGAATSPLFVLNHYLVGGTADGGIASEALATIANADQFVHDRLTTCTSELGRAPTFVVVDFYDIGNIEGDVEQLARTSAPAP
jgi:hypothetical protein